MHTIHTPLLFQATPDSDQVLVYVAAEFAANLFPENMMFTLGSGELNDNDKYTNPTLQYSTAYTYFVICLPDTTPDSLNVGALQPCCWCSNVVQCWCCLFVVSQDPPALRVTDYSLAGFSSFGSEFTTPPGEWHSDHCKDNSAFMCSSLILTSHLPFTLTVHCLAQLPLPQSLETMEI